MVAAKRDAKPNYDKIFNDFKMIEPMFKKVPFILILVLWSINATAQFSQDVGPSQSQLPSTSMEGEAQKNFSVDLFTGITTVTIPIYKNVINGLDFGVSLNYGCKGILVDQIASSEGLGWDLSANSYITRTVNDMEDEVTLNSDINHKQYRGVWVDSENIFWNPDPNRVYEHEYDKFHAVIAGRSFDFVMKRVDVYNPATGSYVSQYSAYTYPKSNIQVQLTLDGSVTSGLDTLVGKSASNHIISFNITDERGNLFEFQRGDYEWKNCYDQQTGNVRFVYYPTTRWVVKRVTTSTGATINYSYKNYNVSYPFYSNESEFESGTSSGWAFNYLAIAPVYWGGILSHIASIQYPNGDSVIFNLGASTGTPRVDVGNTDILRSITIKNGYDNNLKNTLTYQFGYSYFNTPLAGCSYSIFQNADVPYEPSSGSDYVTGLVSAGLTHDSAVNHCLYGLRLKLNAIDKVGNDGSTDELYYSFAYNTTPLPLRLSQGQDIYGYYNAKIPQRYIRAFDPDSVVYRSGTPTHTVLFNSPYGLAGHTNDFGVDRKPDIYYLQAGVLNYTKNSMGGQTYFYYGAHNLSIPSFNNHTIPTDRDTIVYDGLCTDSIIYKDGYSSDNNVGIYYNFSNGLIFNPVVYTWYIGRYWFGTYGTHEKIRWVTNKIINPFEFFHNSNHGYSNAAVTQKGYNGEILSYTLYTYSNVVNNAGNVNFLDDDKSQWYMRSFPPTVFQTYQLGLPLVISQYSSPGGNPLSITSYTYDTSIGTMPPNSINYFFYIQDGDIVQPDSTKSYTRTYLPFYTAKMRVKSIAKTRWSGSDAYINTSNYTYDAGDFITSSQFTDSRGRKLIKNISYNTSYDPYSYPGLTSNLLPGNHFSQDPITEETDDLTDVTNPKVLSFSQKIPNYSSGKFLVDSIASATIDSPVLVSKFHNLDTNNFYYNQYVRDIIRFTKRDDHNNILESWKNNVYNSCIWDCRIGQKIADVSNAQYRDIAYTSFEGSFAGLGVTDYNKGNWDFNPLFIAFSSAGSSFTGKYYYTLQPTPINNSVSSVNTLISGRKYLVTLWATNMPTVKLGTATIVLQNQMSSRGWNLYTAFVTGTGNTLTIQSASGLTTNLDEVRLCPVEASMATYTYEPLFGPSSKCDERNNVFYYFYDMLGRLKMVKDIKGNILSYTKQVNQGFDN
ncbi:MAG: hypothetical protein ACTHJ0_13080 [Flavipsychrobacter sp.]